MTCALALALFDNANAGNKVLSRLKQLGGEGLITTFKATKNAHGKTTWSGSWAELVTATRTLTDAIRSAG